MRIIMNTIEKLEAQLSAARIAARSPINAILVAPIEVPNVSAIALSAAQDRLVVLQDDVRVIDANIQGLFEAVNNGAKATLARIDVLNKGYLVASNEEDASRLKAQLESEVNRYGMDVLSDPTGSAAYAALKRERNVAVQALASHMTIVAALASI